MSNIENKQSRPWFAAENRSTLIQEYGIFLAFLLLAAILSVSNPYFLTPGNVSNVLLQTSINGVLAIGMTFVILTRGIDLSVGSVVALAGIVSASFATTSATAGIGGAPYPFYLALAIGILVGVACGTVVGMIVSRFSVPAFVATLGMLSAARGMTLIYGGGKPVPALTPEFRWIGTGSVLGVPMPVILLALVFFASWWVLTRTRFGRYIYAVGGNPHAAKTSRHQRHAHSLSRLRDLWWPLRPGGHDALRPYRVGPATGRHRL